MATFAEFRQTFSREKKVRGTQFERVCKWILEHDPTRGGGAPKLRQGPAREHPLKSPLFLPSFGCEKEKYGVLRSKSRLV